MVLDRLDGIENQGTRQSAAFGARLDAIRDDLAQLRADIAAERLRVTVSRRWMVGAVLAAATAASAVTTLLITLFHITLFHVP